MYLKGLRRSAFVLELCYFRKSITSKGIFGSFIVAILFLSVSSLKGQARDTLVIPTKNRAQTHKLTQCETPYLFTSDTTDEHEYYNDRKERRNTISICPQYPQQRITVKFLEFDLAEGDTVFAYDGYTTNAPLLGIATGKGIRNAFGGELFVSFSRDINITSCITFSFHTNGDNLAGKGWKAEVQCKERNLAIIIPQLAPQQFDCMPSYASVTIFPATITSNSGPIPNDTTKVHIVNKETGVTCGEVYLSKKANSSINLPLGPGIYILKYVSLLDPTLTGSSELRVIPPDLVCKESMNIRINENCQAEIMLEDLLIDYCPTQPGIFYYNYIVRDEQGNLILNGNTIDNAPSFTLDNLAFCRNGNFFVDIQREYIYTTPAVSCVGNRVFQTCSTELIIEDQAAPTFVEAVQTYTLVACAFDLLQTLASIPTPVVIDACGQTLAEVESTTPINDNVTCSDPPDFVITWRASDECGNTIRRADTLRVIRPTPEKTTFFEDITLSCEMDPSAIPLPNVTPILVTSFQVGNDLRDIDTIPLPLNTVVCDYQLAMVEIDSTTECSGTLVRNWILTDLCNQKTIPLDTQIIRQIDTIAPTIFCSQFSNPNNPELISLPIDGCQITLDFPLPMVIDNCDDRPIVREFTIETLVNGRWLQVAISLFSTPLQAGAYRIGYEALDACNAIPNRSICFRYFTITEDTAPIAICQEDIEVFLGDDGMVSISAQEVDNNSTDNCGIELLLIERSTCIMGDQRMIERKDSTIGIDLDNRFPSVDFSCCDLRERVLLELLVVDSSSNFSTCSTDVLVLDTIQPVCTALAPSTSTCLEFEITDLGRSTDVNENGSFDPNEWLPLLPSQINLYNANFGNPFSLCTDNTTCSIVSIEQEYQLIEGLCGSIRIQRRYRASDNFGNVSEWLIQDINILYQPTWTIHFPADILTNCAADKVEDPESPIENGRCDDLTWSFRDEIIEFENGGVREILRTFNVINLCLFNDSSQEVIIPRRENEQGFVNNSIRLDAEVHLMESHFVYTQKIRFVDKDAPFVVLGEVDNMLLGKGDAEPLEEEDQTLGAEPFECDDVRTFSVFARDCNEPSTETLVFNWEFFSNDSLIESGMGSSFMQTVLPDSQYTVRWVVTDVFGNQTDTSANYTFVDAVSPTALCRRDTVKAFIDTSTREASINIDSLNVGSFDNCDKQVDLDLFLWHELLNTDMPQVLADVLALPNSVSFDCPELGVTEVSLFSVDQQGNFSSCTSIVEILEGPDIDCSETMVGGVITNRLGLPIEAANVEISGNSTTIQIQSNEQGAYLKGVAANTIYTIRPTLDNHPLNGVTTYDLLLISKHLVGEQKFSSPFQYIAADVNNSGTVSTYDIVQLRQLILHQLTAFPNNNSWRFFKTDNLPQSNQPSDNLHEYYEVRTSNIESLDINFIGIKIGDVDASAIASIQHSKEILPRNASAPFTLYTDDLEVKKGNTYTIPIYSTNLNEVTGFQATFKFHNLILTKFIGGVITSDHTYSRWRKEEEGLLTISWHSLLSHDNNHSLLFNLIFKATQNGHLQELLTVSSDPTPAEAYCLSGQRLGIQLSFRSDGNMGSTSTPLPTVTNDLDNQYLDIKEREAGFRLYQNHPNPFSSTTNITFYLPKAAMTALSVFDIRGRMLFQTQQHYETGTQQITLTSDHLPTGTYFYQVATPLGVATKKLIIIK